MQRCILILLLTIHFPSNRKIFKPLGGMLGRDWCHWSGSSSHHERNLVDFVNSRPKGSCLLGKRRGPSGQMWWRQQHRAIMRGEFAKPSHNCGFDMAADGSLGVGPSECLATRVDKFVGQRVDFFDSCSTCVEHGLQRALAAGRDGNEAKSGNHRSRLKMNMR